MNECANAHSIRGPGFESCLAASPPDLDTTAPNYGTCQEQSGGSVYAYAFAGCWQMTTSCIMGAGGASINSSMAMDETGMSALDGTPLHSLACSIS
jgi:hypothetical protein